MRNYLIKGTPGTGKTYLARAAAYYVCHEHLPIEDVFSMDIAADMERIEGFVHSSRCEFVQVHASMGYEDIVYGALIRAAGAITVDYAEKRIKELCDRARGQGEQYCVIFDDISRTNAGSLLGNLLYAMEYRNTPVHLGSGETLVVPENVVFIFTECVNHLSQRLDYALRRRMDYVKELYPDEQVLAQYYAGCLGVNGGQLVLDTFRSICAHIDRSILAEHKGRERDFYPGHGLFIVGKVGTPHYILDCLRQRLVYQVFPHVRQLLENEIIGGDAEALFTTVLDTLNAGVEGINRITSIRKILARDGAEIPTYSLADTIDYYRAAIIPGGCTDNKGMLEAVIDGIILNRIFPYDLAMSTLLTNRDIAAIPSKREPGVYASYLVRREDAADFFYESARKGRGRAPHQYYSTNSGNVGRWAARRDVAAYAVTTRDEAQPQVYLPLNGLRLHNFTTENVRKADNAAEIYGALYRLAEAYLKAYAINISLVMGQDDNCRALYQLITLEIRYLSQLNQHLRSMTAPSQSALEKVRIAFFGTKLMQLRTLWNEKDSELVVDEEKFRALLTAQTPFTLDAYEDIFSCTPETGKIIKLEGVEKMVDLKDYQKIMENIGVRQMIFQGPPGTSKTFESKKFVLKQLAPTAAVFENNFIQQEDISRALDAYKLTEADYNDPAHSQKLASGGWDLVQFHPSYGYEDFIRGIEVKTADGVPTYHTVNRILGKIAAFAKASEEAAPENPPKFYLLIDEINRANLATVFGELIYGLEYRNSKVSTPYEVQDLAGGTMTKDIVLGKNLFIIGTMNTADKSIDAIDYAIRRRFMFIDSPADRNIVIQCYQNASGHNDQASIELMLFDAVQTIFDDPRYFNTDYQKNDVRLGHTYFLRRNQDGYGDDMVERFVFQIIPILKEYVKDGILDSAEDLIPAEHGVDEVFSETDAQSRLKMLGDNIMVYAKEFGSTSRFGAVIDNSYIGNFVDDLREKFGY